VSSVIDFCTTTTVSLYVLRRLEGTWRRHCCSLKGHCQVNVSQPLDSLIDLLHVLKSCLDGGDVLCLVEHISPCLHWTTCLSHSVHYLYNIWTARHHLCVSHVRTTSIYASNHRTERSQLNNSQNSALFSFTLNPRVMYLFQFCLTSHHYILHLCETCHRSSNSYPQFL